MTGLAQVAVANMLERFVDDILLLILAALETKSLIAASCLNKRFLRLARDDRVWVNRLADIASSHHLIKSPDKSWFQLLAKLSSMRRRATLYTIDDTLDIDIEGEPSDSALALNDAFIRGELPKLAGIKRGDVVYLEAISKLVDSSSSFLFNGESFDCLGEQDDGFLLIIPDSYPVIYEFPLIYWQRVFEEIFCFRLSPELLTLINAGIYEVKSRESGNLRWSGPHQDMLLQIIAHSSFVRDDIRYQAEINFEMFESLYLARGVNWVRVLEASLARCRLMYDDEGVWDDFLLYIGLNATDYDEEEFTLTQ